MDYATTYYKSMEIDDAESWGSAVADFTKYGITSSLASGALGLANTAGAFANMFGADYKELELVKSLDNMGLKATAKYAQENKTLVEFGGVVAGSLVPGFLGLKALKMAQNGLSASSSASRTVTGLRAALVPKNQLDMMVEDMARKGTVATANSQLAMRAAKQGVHQQLLEASFAETAILLTMNQHSMLNDQDLSYMESLKSNFDSLVFGVALGGGIGAAAMTMGLKNQMQKVITQRQKEIRDVATGAVANGNLSVFSGDILAQVAYDLERVKHELTANPGDAFKRGELLKTQNILETTAGEVIRETVKQSAWAGSPEYAGHITAAFTELARNLDAATAVNNFAGLQRIKGVKEEYTLFEPRAESYAVYDDIAGIEGFILGIDPTMPPNQLRQMATEKWQQTYGFAYTGRNKAEVKAAVLNGNVPGVTRDHMLATMRHEIGHLTGKQFAQVLDTKFGKHIRKQMEEVSRLARPGDWATVDAYTARIKAQRAEMAKPEFNQSMDEADAWARDLEAMQKHIDYMKNPDELIADNLSLFTTDRYEKLATSYKDLDSLFRGNNLLRTRMRQTDVIMDLKTGNLTKQVDRIPTIADLGKFKISGGKVILEVGKADTRMYQADAALDIVKDSPELASAKYLWAKMNPFTHETAEVTLGTLDFAGFNRVLDGAQNHRFAGKVVVEDLDKATGVRTGTRTFDFASEPERAARMFRNYVLEQKVSGIENLRKRISKGGKGQPAAFGIMDVARTLDMDINFAEQAQVFKAATPEALDGAGVAFWSEKYDPAKPTQVKNVYHRDLGAPTSETEVRTMMDAKKRIDMVRESAALQIASFWGSALKDVKLNMPDPTVFSKNNRVSNVTQADPTQGFFNAQNPEYGDAVEYVNSVGRGTGMIIAQNHKKISEIMEPAAHSLLRSPEGLAEFAVSVTKFRQYKMEEILPEWSAPNMEQAGGAVANWFNTLARQAMDEKDPMFAALLDEKMQRMGGVLERLQKLASGSEPMKFVSYDVLKKLEDIALATKVDRDAIVELLESVPHQTGAISQPTVANFWRAAREANQATVKGAKLSASLKGKSAAWNADQFYPGALDRQLYKDIVFVKPKVTGLMGEKEFGIIGGPNERVTAEKLSLLRAKHGDNFETITQNSNAERHKQLLQDYEEGLNMDSFYFDSSKLNLGKAADIMPDPNPQLVWSTIESYKKQSASVNRNLVKQYYDEEFQFLEAQEEMRRRASGVVGEKDKEASTFQDRMATMLNMPNDNRFKEWRSLQRGADRLFSTVYNTLITLPARAVAPDLMDVPKANYQEMNKLAEKYGLPQMYTEDLQDYLVTSMKLDDQLLANAVPKLNWIGATFTLRLDYIQPVINAISLPILANPEIKHLIDALPELKRQAVKDSLTTSATTKQGIPVAKDFSNTKLMMQGTVNWFKNPELHTRYRSLGIIGERAQLYMNAVDSAAMVSQKMVTDTAGVNGAVKEALAKAGDLLTRPGDNMEDFVRFLAADMARQVLETAGVKGKVADMAIQSYVTRVTGNYHYAQRPGMFQGFGGQAIGLFQTYQFNLIQQVLRHLGEKPSRAAAMMGLQTGIFGLQSTPGFEALNNHIAERSKYEGDFYTGAKQAIGQTSIGGAGADEWLLYGLASNFTRPLVGDGIDLFSRGNLNPRSPIIIPANFEDIPLVSFATKFAGSMAQAADNLAGGVPVSDTFWQALATNGVNRPLQGIGQLVAGERITSRGSFLLSTDDLDWWQKGARVLGARGMDEALAVSHYYRAVKYESARQDKLEGLGQTVKAHMQAGSWDGEAYSDFMEKYTQQGGDIQKFDSWSQGLYKSASQSQINQMYQKHDSVEGRYMQQVMGAGVEQYIDPWNTDAL